MLHGVEVFHEYVEVELPEFGLQHEDVVPDADEAQWVEGVQLDLSRVVQHEEEGCLKHLLHRVLPALQTKNSDLINTVGDLNISHPKIGF